MVELSCTPIDPARLEAAVDDPTAGAVVLFVGKVRNHHRGRAVDHLEYEAYEPMAIAHIERLAAEATAQYGLVKVAVAHRLGRLQIGDVAVVVAVSSAHREAAFDGCRQIMERIKHEAPIFKHEMWSDGSSEWVGPDEERSGADG